MSSVASPITFCSTKSLFYRYSDWVNPTSMSRSSSREYQILCDAKSKNYVSCLALQKRNKIIRFVGPITRKLCIKVNSVKCYIFLRITFQIRNRTCLGIFFLLVYFAKVINWNVLCGWLRLLLGSFKTALSWFRNTCIYCNKLSLSTYLLCMLWSK